MASVAANEPSAAQPTVEHLTPVILGYSSKDCRSDAITVLAAVPRVQPEAVEDVVADLGKVLEQEYDAASIRFPIGGGMLDLRGNAVEALNSVAEVAPTAVHPAIDPVVRTLYDPDISGKDITAILSSVADAGNEERVRTAINKYAPEYEEEILE